MSDGQAPGNAPLNHNVKLILLYGLTLMASMSLYSGTQLSAYIYLITESNTKVGFVTGVRGVFTVLLAYPSGAAADKYGRVPVLRAAGVVALCAAAYMAFCVAWVRPNCSEHVMFMALCGCGALWGLFVGGHQSPLEAIFADSIASGDRSKLYSWRQALVTVGNASGPVVAIFVFWQTGNKWELPGLSLVMLIGLGCIVVPWTCLMMLSQTETLGEASEALTVPKTDGNEQAAPAGSSIPALVASSDLLTSLASGMTINFFPLFFWHQMHLSPIAVNGIFVAGPVGVAIAALLVQKLSKRIGRIEATLCVKFVGITLLAVITVLSDNHELAPLVVGLYLARTWLMNAPRGLTKSVLNDYTTKAQRGRWNALESVNRFSWAGSAALGGVLVDQVGWKATFAATCVLQALGTSLLFPLIPLVHRERAQREGKDDESRYSPLKEDLEAEHEQLEAPVDPRPCMRP
eukprot:TRINITY_DN787_c0_g1_i9.p1 TRINITY_DN787_c0_g1~~TRINITY_DN787_c0_g1_i9.p1  ORF type:complete len:462 (+),score=69.84 TRINITY_DN787_c0_g1_i9:186-1571(+)